MGIPLGSRARADGHGSLAMRRLPLTLLLAALPFPLPASEPGNPAEINPLLGIAEQWMSAQQTPSLNADRTAADAGDAQAQFRLGLAYHLGRGVPMNDAEAVGWWRKSATLGFAPAQTNLGIAWALGQGVQRDDAKAVKWWERAALSGEKNAQMLLGIGYETGRYGLSQDYAQATQWYSRAANQGSAQAQANLGGMILRGQGVPKDEDAALAAAKSRCPGQCRRGVYAGRGL